MNETRPVIEIKDLKIRLGGQWIHNGINLTIEKGEIIGIVGQSGSGKTTLMREMLMLQRPDSGSIKIFDHELMTATPKIMKKIEKRWGVLFQQNALFSSLTLLENIEFPLREYAHLEKTLLQDLALQKILSVGLDAEACIKYPAQLSGGMQKRAALARALVLDPELLFLDEPTAALDPDSAASLDDLIKDTQKALGLTVVIITHDLDTLWRITDRVAFLYEGKVLCFDKIENLVNNQHEAIQEFFNGPRGRTATAIYMDKHNGN
jgi:phospholipid/cholesterol/gamma-HCH transport system ATP-binding protein